MAKQCRPPRGGASLVFGVRKAMLRLKPAEKGAGERFRERTQRTFKTNRSHWLGRTCTQRRLRNKIRQLKPAGEGLTPRGRLYKQSLLEESRALCRSFPMETIAGPMLVEFPSQCFVLSQT